jgi:signal transduction histidine kinase
MIKTPSSLRRRIITATFVLAALICGLFSVGWFASLEYAEWILFDKHIESDMATFVSQYQQDPNVVNLPHHSFKVFVAPGGDETALPAYLQGRSDAGDEDDADDADNAEDDKGDVDDEDDDAEDDEEENDEVVLDGHEYHLDIREVGGTTFYFMFDETEFEAFDQLLNVFVPALILLICAVAATLGLLLAHRISRPVTALVNKVNQMEMSPAAAPAQATGKDEIEVLSQAIDSFQARVAELLTREREFSTDVSHELRTPLMGIQAAAENLQVAAITPQRVDELSRRIEARCMQMRALVDAMLSLARDPQSLENDFQEIPLAAAVREQLEVAAPHIESKGIKVHTVGQAQPKVFTSAAILDVVVGNLLRNAIFHSESTEVELELGERSLTVRDFGRGIPAEMQSRLFDRYFSNGGDPARDLGIGLALVKRICAHFRWNLSIDSRPGQGTAIAIDFGASIRKG